MDKSRKKFRIPKIFKFLIGYSIGTVSWLLGLHCIEVGENDHVFISARKWMRHLLKVSLWTLEIALVLRLLALYREWILSATVHEVEVALLVKSVVFLYIKVFWPRVFPEILPGLHVFFCPQCYQKRTFRFLPVSFQFGFFVTYLCRYCSCLVNGWGEQIFYPVVVPSGKIARLVSQLFPTVLLAILAGLWVYRTLWNLF